MISEPDEQQWNEPRALTLSFLASLAVNILAWALVIWLYGVRFTLPIHEPSERDFLVTSSSVRIEHRTVPQPHSEVAQPRPQQPQPEREAVRPRAEQPRPQARPTEIARIVERATPQPTLQKRSQTTNLQSELQEQQQQFEREAQQLNAARAPLSIATVEPGRAPSADHPYKVDLPGMESQKTGNGVLDPIRSWRDGGLDCYYGRYTWVYAGGGTESAIIPWPFCYRPERDPIVAGVRRIPFPLPMAGYRLPPGTVLDPIEKEIYEQWLASQ